MQLLINDLFGSKNSGNVVNRFWIVDIYRVGVNFLHGVNLVCLFFVFFTHVRVYEFLFRNRIFLFNDVVKIIMSNNETFIFEFLYLV